MPKLSIIIATYNSASVIGNCLASISAQTFTDYEVILVDGDSVDDTLSVVRSHKIQFLHLISEPDTGIYSAWNKGLEQANGEWITFIGSDDVYAEPTSLQDLMQCAADNPRSPFVYGKLVKVDEKGAVYKVTGSPWRNFNGFLQNYIYAQFPFPIMSAAYQNKFLKKQTFNECYKIAGDMDLILRCLGSWQGRSPAFFDSVIVKMAEGGVSTNPAFYLANILETYRFRRANAISVMNLGLTLRTLKMVAIITTAQLFGSGKMTTLKKSFRKLQGFRHLGL